MRYIYLLLITFIFASCGNQKLRFTRVNSSKQKVVEINDIPTLKIKTETAFNYEPIEETSKSENAATSSAEITTIESTEDEPPLNLPEVDAQSFPENVQDSTTVTPQEAQRIQDEALRAERLGNASLALSLVYFLFVAGIVIGLLVAFSNNLSVGFIVAIIFGILALVSLIISIILGAKSLSAAYNTPKGRKRAIGGIVISSVIIGLMLLNILLGIL